MTLTFPGDSSWAGVYRGKPAVERWLRRFVATGLQIYPDEVVATGFPWKTTACIRGRIHLRDESGAIVYENRFVIWGHLAWGRMRAVRGLRGHAGVGAARCLAGRAPAGAGRRLVSVAAQAAVRRLTASVARRLTPDGIQRPIAERLSATAR